MYFIPTKILVYFTPIYLNEQSKNLNSVLFYYKNIFSKYLFLIFFCSKCVSNLNVMIKLGFSRTQEMVLRTSTLTVICYFYKEKSCRSLTKQNSLCLVDSYSCFCRHCDKYKVSTYTEGALPGYPCFMFSPTGFQNVR